MKSTTALFFVLFTLCGVAQSFPGSQRERHGLLWGNQEDHGHLQQAKVFRRSIDSNNVNILVDNILSQLTEELRREHKSMVDLPDINEHAAGDTLKFEARFGRVGDFSTLRRNGDAALSSVEGESASLTAPLTLNVTVEYQEYIAKALFIGPSGHIKATVKDVTIVLTLAMRVEGGDCFLELSDFKVTELDNFFVEMTGMGPLNVLYSLTVSLFMDALKENVRSFVEDHSKTELEKILRKERFSCSDF